MADKKEPLLSVEHLTKEFPVDSGVFASRLAKKVSAVDDVSFEIFPGETFGLVGESGCGKSTTGRCIMRLTHPTGGRVVFDGQDVATMHKKQLKAVRHDMQYIFQDPYASLDPRMTIGEIVSEPLAIHNEMGSTEERIDYVRQLLDIVGLNPEHINRYPHEFSGGQRQRVGIARAFALHPKLIICDEPVSALDVSIQAQVLNLLGDLQKEYGTAYLFIAHDLSVVQHISDRVAVMYLGNLMETSDWRTLYAEPYHPYTQALLSAASASSSPATRRAPSTLRAAAASIRAAPSRRRYAPRRSPRCARWPPAITVRATSPSRSPSRDRPSSSRTGCRHDALDRAPHGAPFLFPAAYFPARRAQIERHTGRE